MKPRVAIIYLCWGMRDYVHPVVKALASQSYPKGLMKIFMVTAGSKDGIQEVIKKDVLPRSGSDLPETVLLDDPVNRGFAGNNNVAVKQALDEGFDYIFLHNGDLALESRAIEELVNLAESDDSIGSVQSLVTYWDDHEKVNVSGGVFHVAGYGYARDNLKALSDLNHENGDEIAYASGAAVLYRTDALRKVGMMEEGFFMYHEDLELGLRLRMAGYKNVLATKSLAYHDYNFSRNTKKFAWMELYRVVAVKAYYKIFTLILLAPILLVIEAGTWLMALKGGWVQAKFYQYTELMKPRTWKLILKIRKRAQSLRIISDKEFLQSVSGSIAGQETESFIVTAIANPIIELYLRCVRAIVIW